MRSSPSVLRLASRFERAFLVFALSATSLSARTVVAGPTRPEEFGAPGPWEPVRSENGVVVEQRRFRGSALREFRGRGVVEAPLARILSILETDAKHPDPTEKCDDAHRPVDPNVKIAILYDRMKAPWPVSDRDAVLRAETLIDTAAHLVRIDFSTTEDLCVPLTPGVIRMPLVRGHYLLRPLHDGAFTDVEYQVRADPGGTLPGWAVNLTAKNLPMNTITDFRKKASAPRYQAVADGYVCRADYQELVRTASPSPAASPRPVASPAPALPPSITN